MFVDDFATSTTTSRRVGRFGCPRILRNRSVALSRWRYNPLRKHGSVRGRSGSICLQGAGTGNRQSASLRNRIGLPRHNDQRHVSYPDGIFALLRRIGASSLAASVTTIALGFSFPISFYLGT
jgi:hypothetical protein